MAWAAAGGEGRMLGLLIQFGYLQTLDVLTTLVFLTAGVREANPVVRFALHTAPSPLVALAAVKGMAALFALLCWRTGRRRPLVWANVSFAVLVLWNLVALLAT